MTAFGGWLRKAARRRYAQLIHRLLSANIGNRGFRPQAAGRSITTNNQPRQSGADIVAIALSFFKLSQSESGDAETKKREGGGLRRSR
jgi:hypothetical protein